MLIWFREDTIQALQAGLSSPTIDPSSLLVLNEQSENILEREQIPAIPPNAVVPEPETNVNSLLVLLGALGAAAVGGIAIVIRKKNAAK